MPRRPAGPELRELAAGEAAHEDRRVAAPAGEVLDQVEEGGLRPLHVVQHDHERPLAGERLEQPPHRPVELVAADVGSARPTASRTRRAHGRRVRLARQRLRRGRAGATISTSGQYVIPLPYGRQRPSSTTRRLASEATSSAASRDLPTPGSPRTVTMRHERSALARSNSARRRASSAVRSTSGESIRRAARNARLDLEQAPGATGSTCPSARAAASCSAVTASRTSLNVASPTRISPPAACLEPLRDDDGVAGREGSPCDGSPGEDLAGVDPGADADPHAVRAARARRSARDSSRSSTAARTARRASSSCTTGNPEDGEDGVADELLDRAAVPFEHLARGLVIARPHAAQRFRIEPLAERVESATSQKTSVTVFLTMKRV